MVIDIDLPTGERDGRHERDLAPEDRNQACALASTPVPGRTTAGCGHDR
jgi:hypothetical protein